MRDTEDVLRDFDYKLFEIDITMNLDHQSEANEKAEAAQQAGTDVCTKATWKPNTAGKCGAAGYAERADCTCEYSNGL